MEPEFRRCSAPPTSKDLGDEGAARGDDMGGDRERCQQQLRLNVLVQVMQPRHVWGAVAHHEVSLAAVEVRDDLCVLQGQGLGLGR